MSNSFDLHDSSFCRHVNAPSLKGLEIQTYSQNQEPFGRENLYEI